jgi:hypothetical protein
MPDSADIISQSFFLPNRTRYRQWEKRETVQAPERLNPGGFPGIHQGPINRA